MFFLDILRRLTGTSSRWTLVGRVCGWMLVCWIVVFWRLGYPSFWDPDEAIYAQASREMLRSHQWLVPVYNGGAHLRRRCRVIRTLCQRRTSLSRLPVISIATLLAAYSAVVIEAFPAFERAKPIRSIATWMAQSAKPSDRLSSFRLNRWSSSWRFY